MPPTPKTYSDLFAELKKTVKIVPLEDLKRRYDARAERSFTLVDVREKEEFRAGYIPGAVHLSRSYLESQSEQKLPDRDAEILVYCAGGNRSLFAAKSLLDMGYTNVASANPGFVRWKDLGYPVELPPQLTPAQRPASWAARTNTFDIACGLIRSDTPSGPPVPCQTLLKRSLSSERRK
jgi:rhodanese-related sulfurtransferase